MDIYESNGLSWADQWGPQPLPSERHDSMKEKDGNNKSGKRKLNMKWIKKFCKTSKTNKTDKV